ncbi:15670_t:CDS:1, partial [Acaulospora morrowiae]
SNIGYHSSIVKCLILQYHWFFNTEEEEASDIEYQEELLDLDIEVSEPEGETDGLQENNISVDDTSSFDNRSAISESYAPWPSSEPVYGTTFDEARRSLSEEPVDQILEDHLEEHSETEMNSQQIPLIHVHEETRLRETVLTDVTEESEEESSESPRHFSETEVKSHQESDLLFTQIREESQLNNEIVLKNIVEESP